MYVWMDGWMDGWMGYGCMGVWMYVCMCMYMYMYIRSCCISCLPFHNSQAAQVPAFTLNEHSINSCPAVLPAISWIDYHGIDIYIYTHTNTMMYGVHTDIYVCIDLCIYI
jgi:hypothetical protein